MVEVQNKPKVTINGAQESHKRRDKSIGRQIYEVFEVIVEVLILFCRIFYGIGLSIYQTTIAPLPPKPVKGEIVLISGAGHGIGRELALLYAAEGATVVSWDINKKDNDALVEEISARGFPKAHAYTCDVSNRENVIKVAKKVQEEVGDVTILINNAGIMPTHPILDQTQDEIERQFRINVLAHFWTIQAFLPAMKRHNHGHIVGISSIAGLVGLENVVPYCGTKFAVRGLMEGLMHEMRNEKLKIHMTIIFPYIVDTGLCKNPKVKFNNVMPLLKPTEVAKKIMDSQRTNQVLVGIPGHVLWMNNIIRMLPVQCGLYIKDFIDCSVESDLL